LQWVAAIIPEPAGTAVAEEQQVAIVVALGIPVESLKTALGELNASMGQTLLEQQVGTFPPIAFFVLGEADKETHFAGEVAISIPGWKVRYSASKNLLESNTSHQSSFWILVATIIMELGLFLFYRGIKQFRSDQLAGTLDSIQPEVAPETAEQAESLDQAARSFLDSVPQEPLSAGDKKAPEAEEQPSADVEAGPDDGNEDMSFDLDIGEAQQPESAPEATAQLDIPKDIFREYDIRGIVDDQLDANLAQKIGAAVGSEAIDKGETAVVVARDGRLSSPVMYEALTTGILSTGCNVILQGMVPTPLLYFATEQLEETNSGVMVTGSHNPPEYNGFKIVIDGEVLSDDRILNLHRRIQKNDLHLGEGDRSSCEVTEDYISRILGDIVPVSNLKVVVDAGNGAAGPVGVDLLSAIGCNVVPLNCEVDGSFPSHHPDPTITDNLREITAVVRRERADLGIAFDGDGDRIVAVTTSGRIVWPDELLMIYARDVLNRNPETDVVFDVKCSRRLMDWVSQYGGRPVLGKTGHAHMKHKIRECGASLGGEFSGHLYFPDRWYGFDDGIYAAARLMEILTMREQSLDSVLGMLPASYSTPEIIVAVGEEEKFSIVEKLVAENSFNDAKLTTLDGLLADFADARGLVRASKTTPSLSMRFEADNEEALTQVKQRFKRELQKIAPDIDF